MGEGLTIHQRRLQSSVENALFKGRTVIIYGAHQTGKTTLVRSIAEKYDRHLYLDCHQPEACRSLSNRSTEELGTLVSGINLLIIDEGQCVPNIGVTLKQLFDEFPRLQVIATGSMMLFDLANDRNLMLVTGKTRFYLSPLAVSELNEKEWSLEKALVYGMYPAVVDSPDPETLLQGMATRSLYADIFEHEIIRGGDNLLRLLQILALRLGSELSYNEIGEQAGLDKVTVGRYVKLLEQVQIVFRLTPYKRRLRQELNRLRKVYFFDLGVRNSLIHNFNPLSLRMDADALWENYFISERMKRNRLEQRFSTGFYWRTYEGAGLDYLEEDGGHIEAFECRLTGKKWSGPVSFLRTYPNSTLHQVTPENYRQFL